VVNKVVLIGNVGNDLVLKKTESGKSVISFRLATTTHWTDEEGTNQKSTTWHTIVAWGKTAEFCAAALGKGTQVYIEGSLRTRSYEMQHEAGKKKSITVKHYITEVVARDVRVVGVTTNGKEVFYDDARES
jgi:single-strand DNA-binding protein